MFAVIFEVEPKQERWTDYLDLAGMLRPELEKIDGFIDNERFTSLLDRGRVLSLSTWRDEKALIRWRTLASIIKLRNRGGLASSRITTSVSAKSSPTPMFPEATLCRSSGSTRPRAAPPNWSRSPNFELPAMAARAVTRSQPISACRRWKPADRRRTRPLPASPIPPNRCCWFPGTIARPGNGGGRVRRAASISTTGRCASSATTACTTAARPRNITAR